MINDNIGKKKTFFELLDEVASIRIPKVQRDYAYGREEAKVQSILDDMLTGIITAVRDDSSNVLDFVYGGSDIHEKNNNQKGGLIPLDGQQRLTTLFLLHFYASMLDDQIDQEDVNKLTKFSYETRHSAKEFCRNLVEKIRPNLLKIYKSADRNIKDLIVDNALYLSIYDSDPTIKSMLNVLAKIEEKCAELDVLSLSPSLWERLTTRRNVEFYNLSLENFGLTDDLFIKMNARGKKLTDFEIFKSDMIAAIKGIDEKLKDEFSKKIDTEWIDIVWGYTDKDVSNGRIPLAVTNDADSRYSMLFHNIFLIEYYRRNPGGKESIEPNVKSVFCDEEGIKSVMDIFETLRQIYTNGGSFGALWGHYFYFGDKGEVIGRDNSIRLFWDKKRNSIFELAMQGELTIPERVYLYSMYLLQKSEADYSSKKRSLRIIRNLITANVRDRDIRIEKLHGFLKDVEYVIEHNGIDDKERKCAFVQNIWNEEYVKQHMLSQIYEKLLRYENHNILQCSLSLFIDYCKSGEDIDQDKLCELLTKFESVYSNDYLDHFDSVRIALLDSGNDYEYMQYEEGSNNLRKYYFITRPSELSDFYIKKATGKRNNQAAIVRILDEKKPEDFSHTDGLYERFMKDDWRYYVAKYPKQSTRETTYSIGVWDNRTDDPFDLILLNSGQHSENNLEWMMMTHLLNESLADSEKYSLDDHGCSPIVILKMKSATTINFIHGKWQVECSDDSISAIVQEKLNSDNRVIMIEENGKITVQLADLSGDIDYIELGQYIVSLLENIAEPSLAVGINNE